ncbi:MAG: hypothetical protein V3W28_01605 [Thermoplasmata archaeon]
MKVKRKSSLHPRGAKKPKTRKARRSNDSYSTYMAEDTQATSDRGRRLLADPAIIVPCTECAWKLHPGEQRRFVRWKTIYGRTGGPNLVCRLCALLHDTGGG